MTVEELEQVDKMSFNSNGRVVLHLVDDLDWDVHEHYEIRVKKLEFYIHFVQTYEQYQFTESRSYSVRSGLLKVRITGESAFET